MKIFNTNDVHIIYDRVRAHEKREGEFGDVQEKLSGVPSRGTVGEVPG
jgi:hypothetical protein